jgi:hypothetical protein
MPVEEDTRSGREQARRLHLDGPALATCIVASLAALVCVAMGAKHGYHFVVLLLDRGRVPARNAELFTAFGWLAAALVLSLAIGLLLRLMYKINGTAAAPSAAVTERRAWRGRHADGSGRRR